MPAVHPGTSSPCLRLGIPWMASGAFWGQFAEYLQIMPLPPWNIGQCYFLAVSAHSRLAIAIVTNLKLTFHFYFSFLFFHS